MDCGSSNPAFVCKRSCLFWPGSDGHQKCEEPTEFRGHDTTSIECDTNRPPRREAQIPPLNAAPSPTAVVILIVIGSTTPKLHFEPRSRDHPCAYKVPDIEVAGQVWSDTARGMTVF